MTSANTALHTLSKRDRCLLVPAEVAKTMKCELGQNTSHLRQAVTSGAPSWTCAAVTRETVNVLHQPVSPSTWPSCTCTRLCGHSMASSAPQPTHPVQCVGEELALGGDLDTSSSVTCATYSLAEPVASLKFSSLLKMRVPVFGASQSV